jgi:hypothetical protein
VQRYRYCALGSSDTDIDRTGNTDPSADEDELYCELHREEREDVALLEWNFLPGYKVKEERVPGETCCTIYD